MVDMKNDEGDSFYDEETGEWGYYDKESDQWIDSDDFWFDEETQELVITVPMEQRQAIAQTVWQELYPDSPDNPFRDNAQNNT